MANNFSNNVFINCPFDSDYISLLRPLLFTILYLGYNPRIASERSDSGEARFQKICELIEWDKGIGSDIKFYIARPHIGIDIGCGFSDNGRQNDLFTGSSLGNGLVFYVNIRMLLAPFLYHFLRQIDFVLVAC